jgi:putative endonuclease
MSLGRSAEDAAASHLGVLGYQILARNVRIAGCELDLIAREGETIVFVEVRSRSDRRHGGPLETVRAIKQARVGRAATAFLARHGLSDSPARFDVVGIDWVRRRPIVSLVRGAFESAS